MQWPCEYFDAAPHASDEAQRRSLDAARQTETSWRRASGIWDKWDKVWQVMNTPRRHTHFGSFRALCKRLEKQTSFQASGVEESVERTIWQVRKSLVQSVQSVQSTVWCVFLQSSKVSRSTGQPFALRWSLKQSYFSLATDCFLAVLCSDLALFHCYFTCGRFPFAVGISWKIWELGVFSALFSASLRVWV